MTSPPETDRTYAYFRATGVGDTYELEKELSLSPSEAWVVGETFQRHDQTFERKSSSYHLESGHDDTERLETHIEALLSKLTPKLPILNKYSGEYDFQIVCVSFVYQSFSFELPFELQRLATNLGIRFWFDSYPWGDIHEEMLELRSQLSP